MPEPSNSEFEIQENIAQSASQAETPMSRTVINANTNSVKMNEVVGASFLGILSLILLIVLLRAQRRNRQLTAMLAQRAPRLVMLERPHKRQVEHG